MTLTRNARKETKPAIDWLLCWFPAGVWFGAGHSLSEIWSLLEKLVPQVPEEKTELFQALIQQLGKLGSQQIRNVAVRRRYC